MTKNPQLIVLGAHIRGVRKQLGYTQEDVANMAELSRSYYGGIERGERNVAALNLIKIAYHLKLEVGDLFPVMTKFKTHIRK